MLSIDVDDSGRVKGKSSSTVYRIVVAQLLATFLATISCLFIDWVAAYSALLGGLTCTVPSGFMAWRFGTRAVAGAGDALSHLVRGETGKYLLTVAMFIIIFKSVTPIAGGYFFATLGLGLICNILVPLWSPGSR